MSENIYSLSNRLYHGRSILFFLLILVLFFGLGLLDRFYREKQFELSQKKIAPYLNQKVVMEGRVVSFPIPSSKKFSYILLTEPQHFRIQISSSTYQSPAKGDRISIQTKLYVPPFLKETQRIKRIDAYASIHGDGRFKILEEGNLVSTRIRNVIFSVAQEHLSPQSYAYFRAMVFGDQALLGQKTIERLKVTGLLHLFVVSGSHIGFACLLGLWLCRGMLSWFGYFQHRKTFFLWVELGSVLFVTGFLLIINPPISTFRAVGSMILFLGLNWMRRRQQPLWNLGVIFFVTVLFNPLYLFDVSTQLTFASVAGILCMWHVVQTRFVIRGYLVKACSATLGASAFTLPILYLQFGTFYPSSILYNLILVPTIGGLVSFLSLACLVFGLLPVYFFQKIVFELLDFLFQIFEKTIFWEPDLNALSTLNPVFTGISWIGCVLGVGLCGMAFIITQHFFKKSVFLK